MTTELTSQDREIDLIRAQVANARDGDSLAAAHVLTDCLIGLQRVLSGHFPDAGQVESLRFLAHALSEILEQQIQPALALCLENPKHRPASEAIGLRNAMLYVEVGMALDEQTGRGLTREDKPIAHAIAHVAKQHGVSIETVQKAWSDNNSRAGWERDKGDWK